MPIEIKNMNIKVHFENQEGKPKQKNKKETLTTKEVIELIDKIDRKKRER